MENLGPVNVEFLINNPDFTRSSNRVRDDIKGITRTASEEAEKAEQVYKKLGAAIAGYFSIQAVKGFVSEVTRVRGEFQQLEIGLQTILGNKDQADKLLAQVVDLAARTPFSLKELAQGSKSLLAYQFASEDITEVLRRLGDVASGLDIPFNELTQLYGKTRVEGRLFAEDLNQYTGRGIPIIGELAKIMGVAENEVRTLVSAGKVGFPEVQQVIENLTNEGGQFFNLMDNLSSSIPGKISNLGDAFDRMYNEIGQGNQGIITDSISGLIVLVDNYQTVIDIIKALIVTYGSYRAAVMLTSAAQNAMMLSGQGLTAMQILQQKWTVLATRAQAMLNATMLANPYVAAATALAALISALVIFNKNKDRSIKLSDEFKKSIKEEVNASNQLFKALKATSEGTDERAEMIKKVNETYKKYLPQQLTEVSNLEEIEKAQKSVNSAIAESIFLRTQESDLTQLREGSAKYSENFGKAIQDVIKDAKLSSTVGGQLSAEFEKALDELSQGANVPLANVQSKFDKILRDFGLEFSVLGSGSSISTFNYQDLLKDTQSYAAALNREKTATDGLADAKKAYLAQLGLINEEEAKSNEETVEAITTLKTLKEELQGLVEAREKLDINDSTGLAQNESAQIQLQKKIAALEIQSIKEREKESKKTELEKLKERLDEKRKAYDDYYAAIELIGKEAADQQFSNLIKESSTYLEYLKKAQSGIDPTSTDAGRQNVLVRQEIIQASGASSPLERLRTEIAEMKKVFEDFETYKKQFGLEAAKQQYSEQLGEYDNYLSFLRAKTVENQDAFAAILEGRSTGEQRDISKLLDEEGNEAKREERKRFEEQLAELQTYNNERLRLISEYNELKNKLLEAGEIEAAEIARQNHQKELDELDDANVKKLQSYQELQKGIEDMTLSSARKLVERAKDLLASEDMSDELREQIKKVIRDFEREINKVSLDDIFKISTAIGQLGQSLQKLGETAGSRGLANLGGLFSGLAGGVGDLLTAFDKDASSSDVIAAGINGVVRMVDMLAGAAQRRKEAEEAYYRSVIGFQNQYNLSLNEQIRLQSILGESVFLKDFEGRIKDGLSAVTDANAEYQKALEELSKGMAKSGQRNAIDWGSVGQGAASGAAIGATIGSVVPVIGNVVGAVVGGIVGGITGLFAGKKKVDKFLPILDEYPELIDDSEEGIIKLNRALADSLIQNNLVDDATKEILQNILDWDDALEAARAQIAEVISELAGSLGSDMRNALVSAFRDGEDAAVKMGETVEKVLENIIGQLIFNRIFSGAFDKLEADMAASMDVGGDGNWIDDFERFFNTASGLSGDFNDAMQAAMDQAKKAGFDIFQPSGSQEKGLQGAISRMTEETGSELTGLKRASYDLEKRNFAINEQKLMLHKHHYEAVVRSLQHHAAIEKNTADTVERLDDAVVELKMIVKNTTSKKGSRGLGLDD
ncbi:tape measure protein [Belliella sp. DSM 107340]|uniref:Tape measure protein n=1 Tax=Belliella calami TaxID=2923436 RepID=A0ABS9UU25_9BACT|nr:tape measure protein [Belliella calami]MCH7400127.1 tape measure protein [Belliella calami]